MSGLSSFFSLFWFLHLRRIATLDSAFFFLACVFPFLFLLSCWRWVVDRWPTMATDAIVLFFFWFFFGGVPSMDLSPGWWTIVPRPYVHQPAPSMSPSSMFVCFFVIFLDSQIFTGHFFFFVTAGYRLEIGFTRSYFCFRSLDFVLLEFNGIQRLYPYYLCFDSISLTLMKRFIWLDWLSLDSTRFNRLLLAFTGIE